MADAEPLAERLRAAGHEVMIEPMLEIRFHRAAPLNLTGVQALLLTSANGVRALAGRDVPTDLPVLAVGDATERAARAAGFARVESAGGDAGDLARLALARLRPGDGALLHVAGEQVAGGLAGPLRAAGFDVRRQTLYEARQATSLSPECAAVIRERRLDAVLFFSPRSAQAFARLAASRGLDADCGDLDALCLSPAVAAALKPLSWRCVRVAARPHQGALLALLNRKD